MASDGAERELPVDCPHCTATIETKDDAMVHAILHAGRSETEEETDHSGLYAKYEVQKDGEPVEDCFVLEPEDDQAARAALKAYAAATENDELADDLRDQFDLEQTPEEEWERHNEPFQYEPPEGPPETWSSEDYTELHDRVIGRRTEWYCQHCSGAPFSSLEKARRHVQKQHGEHLYEKYGGSHE